MYLSYFIFLSFHRSKRPQIRTDGRNRLRSRGFPATEIDTVPEDVPYHVNPNSTTGLTFRGNPSLRGLQPLAQDPTMPILEQPDASTTIEEVKRRLIEETDGSYDNPISNFVDLNVAAQAGSSAMPMAPVPISAAVAPPTAVVHELPSVPGPHDSSSDSDSSTETAATFTGGQAAAATEASPPPATAHQTVQSHDIPVVVPGNADGSGAMTTVLYFMPNEQVPYKVQLPHTPLTLGQFKLCLPRKSVFKYYFKQHSAELQRPIYFEVTRDSEELPLYDGIVLAKLADNKK